MEEVQFWKSDHSHHCHFSGIAQLYELIAFLWKETHLELAAHQTADLCNRKQRSHFILLLQLT